MTSMGEISPAITTNLREITGKSYIDTKQCHKLHVHCSRKLFSEFLQQELNPGPSTQQSDALLLSYRRLTEATCSWPYTCNAYYSTCRFMYSVGTKRKGEDSNVTNIPFTEHYMLVLQVEHLKCMDIVQYMYCAVTFCNNYSSSPKI